MPPCASLVCDRRPAGPGPKPRPSKLVPTRRRGQSPCLRRSAPQDGASISRHAAPGLLELRVRLLVDLLQAGGYVPAVTRLVLVDEVAEERPERTADRRPRERRVLRIREDLQERRELLVRLDLG